MQRIWSSLTVCVWRNKNKSLYSRSFLHCRQPKDDREGAARIIWWIWSSVPAYKSLWKSICLIPCDPDIIRFHMSTKELKPNLFHIGLNMYVICSCKSSQIYVYVHTVLWKVYNKYCLTVCSKITVFIPNAIFFIV